MTLRISQLPRHIQDQIRRETRVAPRPAVTVPAVDRRSELEAAFAHQLRCNKKIKPPVTEFMFSTDRRWRFDFAWPDMRVAVEVEGGTWNGGRHVTPTGFEGDCEKYNEAALAGWTVIRATSAMVDDLRALRYLWRALFYEEYRP